jgi:hypothetical protein
MDPRRVLIMALAAIPFTVLPVPAEEVAKPGAAEVPDPILQPLYADPAAAVRRPSPMVVEVLAAIEAQRATLRELKSRLSQTRDPRDVQELHRAIAVAKHETEMRLLRIQADYARREGRIDAAARFEEAIATMKAPPVSREAKAPARAVTSAR